MDDKMRRRAAIIAAVTGVAGVALAMPSLLKAYRRVVLRQPENSKGPQLERQQQILGKIAGEILPSPGQLNNIENAFLEQLGSGLQQEVEPNGKRLLMLPTYVTRLPNGEETGDVYAIDIGGTNFRVMYIHLADGRSKVDRQDIKQVAIPSEVYTGTANQLFDFLAEAMVDFMDAHEGCSNTKQGLLPIVGFCWSFPVKQTALNSGKLVAWTKGFTCDGVIGNDPVQLLSEALQRAGRPCNILALLNDTVGVLAAQRYLDPDTGVGVIIGTGTNACYVERVDRVTKWKVGQEKARDAKTCINIEWGAFDSPSLPRCQQDWDLDADTVHRGKYMFEKLLSGMFLGEVARRILLSAAQDQLACVFGSNAHGPIVPDSLNRKGGFTTAHLASVVDAKGPKQHAAAMRKALDGMHVPKPGQQVVYEICRMVALRSATLVACALHALLRHSGWLEQPRRLVITFDGGVYELFAGYQAMLREAMRDMLGEAKAPLVEFTMTKDGSCLGAAVLAAAAAKESQGSQSTPIVKPTPDVH